jgi:hypothetical protein
MVVTLSIGAALWLKLDPTHQVFGEAERPLAAPVLAATATP